MRRRGERRSAFTWECWPTTPRTRRRITRARRCCWRSEEHTSELQSQSNLVCRLLLENTKDRKKTSYLIQPLENTRPDARKKRATLGEPGEYLSSSIPPMSLFHDKTYSHVQTIRLVAA